MPGIQYVGPDVLADAKPKLAGLRFAYCFVQASLPLARPAGGDGVAEEKEVDLALLGVLDDFLWFFMNPT